MAPSDRQNPSRWRVLDERDPAGGRVKAWLFLTHPGPSLLVTVVVVGAAAVLSHRLPSTRTALGLTLTMLAAQLAIGALNDWADADRDAATQRYKPIVRGRVPRSGALVLSVAGFTVSLVTAATFGREVLLSAALVVLAGSSYDLWLKRTPAAVLSWWAGFLAVPLMAMAITGQARAAAAVVPLSGLLALALLLANGVPDIDGDRRAGARTLPTVLGAGPSRALMAAALAAAAIYTVALRSQLGQGGGSLLATAVLGGGAMFAAGSRRAGRSTFAVLALVVAVATVSWLGSLG